MSLIRIQSFTQAAQLVFDQSIHWIEYEGAYGGRASLTAKLVPLIRIPLGCSRRPPANNILPNCCRPSRGLFKKRRDQWQEKGFCFSRASPGGNNTVMP